MTTPDSEDPIVGHLAAAAEAHAASLERLADMDDDQLAYLAEGHLHVEDDDPDYLGECGGI